MKNPLSTRSGKIASAVLAAVVVGGASLGVASAASAHGRGGHDNGRGSSASATHTPRPGHTPRVSALKFEELQDVTISGTTTVGSTLTVSPGIYTPAADSVTYKWQRNGVDIADATGTTYVLTADDAGKQIRVVESVVKTGYKTKIENSNRLWVPVVG